MASEPTTRRFTVDEYHRMAEAGIFHEDDRVELIDGQVVWMSPIGPEHAGCVDDLARLFGRRTGESVTVRVQNPVVLGPHAEPQPDIAVVRRRREGYRSRHPDPADILLIVEVADSSSEYDRAVKIPLYGRAGIPEAWLVNLRGERIEVYRAPGPEGYADVQTINRDGTLAALMLPGLEIGAADVLGK